MGEENSRRGLEKRESTLFILVESAPENIYLTFTSEQQGVYELCELSFCFRLGFSFLSLALPQGLGRKGCEGGHVGRGTLGHGRGGGIIFISASPWVSALHFLHWKEE